MATSKQKKLGIRRKKDRLEKQKQEEYFEQMMAEQEELDRKKAEKERKRREAKKNRQPHATWYDKNNVRVGDDSYPMTKTRTRMHRILNGFFIWCIVCVIVCVVLMVLSFWQGQQYTFFELIAYGGNSINGYSVASLMRIESFILLILAPISMAINFTGFAWFYDNRPATRVNILATISFILAFILFIIMASTAQIIEPMSLLTMILVAIFFITKRKVLAEKPRLKKTKRVRAEYSRF